VPVRLAPVARHERPAPALLRARPVAARGGRRPAGRRTPALAVAGGVAETLRHVAPPEPFRVIITASAARPAPPVGAAQ
jgi:hypothetical protein